MGKGGAARQGSAVRQSGGNRRQAGHRTAGQTARVIRREGGIHWDSYEIIVNPVFKLCCVPLYILKTSNTSSIEHALKTKVKQQLGTCQRDT